MIKKLKVRILYMVTKRYISPKLYNLCHELIHFLDKYVKISIFKCIYLFIFKE